MSLGIKLLEPDDPKLKDKCSVVEDFGNPYYKEMIDEIVEIGKTCRAYASAAPQFGISKQIIIIMTDKKMNINSVKEYDEYEVEYDVITYFNPNIISMKGTQYFCEACMSVRDTIGRVRRPYSIKIEAFDINGNKINKTMKGLTAIIFCHEYDHLSGIEFTDRAEWIKITDIEERIEIRKSFPHVIENKTSEFVYTRIKSKS